MEGDGRSGVEGDGRSGVEGDGRVEGRETRGVEGRETGVEGREMGGWTKMGHLLLAQLLHWFNIIHDFRS